MLNAIDNFFSDKITKVIISRPKDKSHRFKKIVLNQKGKSYSIERFSQKQAFHENIPFDLAKDLCISELNENFNQLNAFDDQNEYSILISKKGKVSFIKKKLLIKPFLMGTTHNRQKNYILKEGEVIPPLVDMGIFTKEGKVVNSMYDKYKQINRFLEIVNDVIDDKTKKLNVIDFGCGKSYLTFILYYYLTNIKKIQTNIIGLDLKEDVIKKCNQTAKIYGYEGLKFKLGDINGYKPANEIDMVISLHACDTATDYVLYNAIKWDAKIILSVPCCQHEVNDQFLSERLSLFSEYGIIQERISALTTDAIRGNLLKVCGYKTNVMEFVELSHTPKNLLIRAVKGQSRAKHVTMHNPIHHSRHSTKHMDKALSDVIDVMEEFSLEPTLYKLLKEDDLI